MKITNYNLNFYFDSTRNYLIGAAPPEGADPATFKVLNEIAGCSRDARYAYAADDQIKNVDPNTFPTDKECVSCDEDGVVFGN